MTLDDLQRRALAYFVSMGWTAQQSAGIVANLWTESRLNPTAVGDGGAAYGIAQWHPDRQQNFAAIIGRDIHGSVLEDQLAFVHAELQGTEKAAGDALRASTTANAAGAIVSKLYERPADREGEATRRGALAQNILEQYGGVAAVQPQPEVQPQPSRKPSMGALELLPIIAQFIPQIASLIKPKSESTARDAALAQTALNTVAQALGVIKQGETANAATVGAAAEKMAADPAAVKAAQAAVVTHPDLLPLMEVGGGVAAAREADIKQQASDKPFWRSSAVFWISILMLPMVYWLVGSLIVGGITPPADAPWGVKLVLLLFGTAWTGEARSGGFNLVIGLILGGICGVYYGISVTQQKQAQVNPSEHP